MKESFNVEIISVRACRRFYRVPLGVDSLLTILALTECAGQYMAQEFDGAENSRDPLSPPRELASQET